jgi:hypothetical protein
MGGLASGRGGVLARLPQLLAPLEAVPSFQRLVLWDGSPQQVYCYNHFTSSSSSSSSGSSSGRAIALVVAKLQALLPQLQQVALGGHLVHSWQAAGQQLRPGVQLLEASADRVLMTGGRVRAVCAVCGGARLLHPTAGHGAGSAAWYGGGLMQQLALCGRAAQRHIWAAYQRLMYLVWPGM